MTFFPPYFHAMNVLVTVLSKSFFILSQSFSFNSLIQEKEVYQKKDQG